jgi:gliding motility-associated-like protein
MAVETTIALMNVRNTLAVTAFLATLTGAAQLNVTTTMTPEELVQNVLVGAGVEVSNVTFNDFNVSQPMIGTGAFTNGLATELGISDGIILCSGLAPNTAAPASSFMSNQNGSGSDPDLVLLADDDINDRTVLEFDFVPTGDSIKFNYVFGSEEYPEFVCSFNDAFGFFLSGPGITGPYNNNAANIAVLPDGTTPVTINNVNNGYNNNPTDPSCPATNPEYYINNSSGMGIVFDGITVVLQARAQVVCGATYHIKLAIGDALDMSYDSGVFLQAGSFASNPVPSMSAATLFGDNVLVEGCVPGSFTVFRPVGTDSIAVDVDFAITGSATNGADFTGLPGSITIPVGQDSIVYIVNALEDSTAEGPETVTFAVFTVNACGDTLGESRTMTILDYEPLAIQTETSLLLTCDQDSIPLLATYTGGYGTVTMVWNDTVASAEYWVPGKEDGDYVVSVSDNCPRSTQQTVHIDAGCEVIIPNVITPNGDGSNDKFVVRGILGRSNQVQIWDRWGKEVLNTSNYRNTFSANDLHDGTYFYKIRVLEKEYNGYFNVLGSK